MLSSGIFYGVRRFRFSTIGPEGCGDVRQFACPSLKLGEPTLRLKSCLFISWWQLSIINLNLKLHTELPQEQGGTQDRGEDVLLSAFMLPD